MTRRAFLYDLFERSLLTFVQGFLAAWLVTGDFDQASLQIGLAAGAIAVAKCLIAVQLPWTASNSASTLPAEVDPPAGN